MNSTETELKNKKDQRSVMNDQVEKFLESGGTITVVEGYADRNIVEKVTKFGNRLSFGSQVI